MLIAACGKPGHHDPASRVLGAADLVEGRYELCTIMHSEVLQLHAGHFEHRIETDIGLASETAGSYRVERDRLRLAGAIVPADPAKSVGALRLSFVIDVLDDKPVLWRSSAMKERSEADELVGQYDLLIYVGPEIGADLSCSAARAEQE